MYIPSYCPSCNPIIRVEGLTGFEDCEGDVDEFVSLRDQEGIRPASRGLEVQAESSYGGNDGPLGFGLIGMGVCKQCQDHAPCSLFGFQALRHSVWCLRLPSDLEREWGA